MIIALDIDGVLAEQIPPLNKFYNKKFGTNYKFEDHISYDSEKVWGCTKQEAVKIIEDFFHSEDFLKMTPVEGSQKAVEILSKKNVLIAVTSRPKFIHNKTVEFIKKYFGNNIKEVTSTGQHNSLAKNTTKYEICASKGVNLLIEDCLEVAMDAAKRGMKVILLDYPWNQINKNYEAIPNNLTRVNNWKEIIYKLK